MSPSARLSAPLEYSWESLWAPYDESSYQAVLSYITPQDTLVEIGAGDLRLAKRMAVIAARVYAIEIQHAILEKAGPADSLPRNLEVIHADARTVSFPSGITGAVLLMRHCTHFDLYVKKLMAIGCNKLITNARWGSGVEMIDLHAPRHSFDDIDIGWYACLCGTAGFKTGPLDLLNPEKIDEVAEVRACPSCFPTSHPTGSCNAEDSGQYQWKEVISLETMPVFPDLSTEIKTLYQEGA